MFYQLPPVGNPVCLHPQADAAAIPLFSSYKTEYYASGTAALAAALAAVRAAVKIKDSEVAEVIIPAYACPDLVSAVVFVGAKPVLVDLEADRPWFDLAKLEFAITERTVAIVAVDLFGINERWQQLKVLARQKEILLIEDSAQYFPTGHDHQTKQQDWQGDLVILSFGRGKPVSLLGGGAVLTKNSLLFEQLPKPQPVNAMPGQHLLFGLKARIYNVMISPSLYWLPQAMPFLHLGETRYNELTGIDALDKTRSNLLGSNILRYQNDIEAIARCKKISSMLDSMEKINNLPRLCNIEENRRYLRYPLLLKAKTRDRVYQILKRAGLGVSVMYPSSLPRIRGLNYILGNEQGFPNADMFASRILTLPTHSFVSEKNIEKMKTILRDTE
jgi:dTDP-4-amino-4,6-dideoxygalactose transaminase